MSRTGPRRKAVYPCRMLIRIALPRLAASIAMLFAIAVLGIACGDDAGRTSAEPPSGVAAFDPARAEALAHAALPQLNDLPGGGWQAGATDLPVKDTSDLDKLMAGEPSCTALAQLSTVQLLFGGGPAAKGDAGRAEINFTREPAKGVLFQTTAQVDVEIKNSIAEADDTWTRTKQVFNATNAKQCLTKILPSYITQSDDSGRASAAFQPIEPTAKAPHGGSAIAFTLQLKIDGIVADGVMEMYLWPYSNAALSTFILGGRSELSKGIVTDILKAVDKRAAEAAQKK